MMATLAFNELRLINSPLSIARNIFSARYKNRVFHIRTSILAGLKQNLSN